MPPKMVCLPRTWRAMYSSFSKRCPSSMDTSSTTSVCTARQRFAVWLLRSTSAARRSAVPWPSPMPAKEWIVTPPMLQAAMPVGAVTTTASDRPAAACLSLRPAMMRRRRKDLPVPALPVKKMLLPSSARV
jgi:hypothetical protein